MNTLNTVCGYVFVVLVLALLFCGYKQTANAPRTDTVTLAHGDHGTLTGLYLTSTDINARVCEMGYGTTTAVGAGTGRHYKVTIDAGSFIYVDGALLGHVEDVQASLNGTTEIKYIH